MREMRITEEEMRVKEENSAREKENIARERENNARERENNAGENSARENIEKPKYLKIIITDRHNIERVNRIIDKFNPEFFILESQNMLCNLKTLHITQNLRRNGCKEMKMKFYKGDLLKVLFSRTTQRSPEGVGNTMPDIDRGRWDEIK